MPRNPQMLRIGGFLFTGAGAAIWLLLTPASQQYEGLRPAMPLTGIELSAIAIFVSGCFIWLACLGFHSVDDAGLERRRLSVVISLSLILASVYFTVRGLDRLTRPFARDSTITWVFWKLLLTGACFVGLPFLLGLVLRSKKQ